MGISMDRRTGARQRAIAKVYLSHPGLRIQRCKTSNLSFNGVFVETPEAARITRGKQVDLIFAIDLGDVIKLHRRKAIVAHVSQHGAGMTIEHNHRKDDSLEEAAVP